ncbi:MAG: hypothetical protein EOO85_33390 [Pedobacter sp.]|nr:MAG: hypothetical protein EOO85_33390 [Pedobacter sp.]
MFEQILELVKEKVGDHQIPGEQKTQVHEEIAGQIKNGLATQAAEKGGIGDLLSSLSGSLSGSPLSGAIAGGVVSSLGSKFGLSPAITGAIAGAIPSILEKFAHKANDPNDNSVTADSIASSLGKGGGLGNLGGLLKGF